MKKYLVRMKKIIALFLLTAMIVPALAPVVKAQADGKEHFSIKVNMGYDGRQELNIHVPVTIEISNNGADFNGSVQLTVPGGDAGIMYEQPLNLAKGATKKVLMFPMFYNDIGLVRVVIADKKGKTVQDELVNTNATNSRNYVRVGILSDDSAVTRILSNKILDDYYFSDLILSTVELSVDDVYDDFEAMESLDVIIISNFSTDQLSSGQVQAIMDWASNGGLLLFGTGDSYKKTLEGFSDVLKYKDEGLIKVKTDYATNNTDAITNGGMFDYIYSIGDVENTYTSYSYEINDLRQRMSYSDYYKLLQDTIDDAVTLGYTEKYEDLFQIFWEKYVGDFADNFFYSGIWREQALVNDADDFKSMYEEAEKGRPSKSYLIFKNYCKQVVYNGIVADIIMDQYKISYDAACQYLGFHVCEEMQKTPVSEVYPLVDASLWKYSFSKNKVVGGNTSAEAQHDVYQYKKYGKGYIAIAAMDFSKNPFVNYKGATKSITNLLAALIGNDMQYRYKTYQNYTWGWNGGSQNNPNAGALLANLHNNNPVPILVYLLVFVAYIITSFSMYSVLKKKKKSLLLWPIIGGLALAGAVLVFFVSFSTKTVKPVMNVVKVVNAADESGLVSNYCTVTLPKNKTYKLNFNKDHSVRYFDTSDGYRVYSDESIKKYKIAFSEKDGNNTVILKNTEVLSNQSFVVTEKNYQHGDVEFDGLYSCGVLTGHVTNNYGYDLDNCCILLDACVVPIGHLKNGESVDLSKLTPVGTVNFYNQYNTNPRKTMEKEVLGSSEQWEAVVLGLGGKSIIKRNAKSNAMKYVIDEYGLNGLSSYYYPGMLNGMIGNDNLPIVTTSKLVFVGFNSRTESIAEGNITEILTEIVYRRIEQ